MKKTTLKIGLTIGLAALLIISIQAQIGESFLQKTIWAEALNNQAVDSLNGGQPRR